MILQTSRFGLRQLLGPFFTLGAALKRVAQHPVGMNLLASLWLASACNAALWRALWRLPEVSGARGVAFGVGFGVLIASAIFLLISLLSFRWTLKPLVTLFLFAAAFGAYFMLTYGVVIDTGMMVNTLQTDPREVRDLLNGRMLLAVLLLAVLPAVWLWRQPVRYPGWKRQCLRNLASVLAAIAVLVGSLLLIFQDFSSLMRNHTQVRYLINPLNSFYGLTQIAIKPLRRGPSALQPLGRDAKTGPSYTASAKPPLLVLVLGETARSSNFSLNGYPRDTNPRLAQERVVSQRNAWSCGTSTAASVPCMFSHWGRKDYNSDGPTYENLLDVLQHAGLAVLWLDNQSGCKGVCQRVPNLVTSGLKDPALCQGGECFDEIMLQQIEQQMGQLPPERVAKGVVVVMHQMGSHGPAYYKRSPAQRKHFMPECKSSSLPQCSKQELTNAYDNSVLYTDYFLSQTIAWLQRKQPQFSTAMLYVSDHGESLGENNLYLHGLPYALAPDVQKHVPWITWLSDAFEKRRQLSNACLASNRELAISHDHYFHSVLGLMDVQTSVYKKELDLYAACTQAGG